MLAAISDTHATDSLPAPEAVRSALDRAEVTLHAGDLTTTAVLSDLESATDRLVAVAGNRDDPAVSARLPAVRTVDALGRRFLVVHGHEHDRTSLSLLARQEGADVAVLGHTHGPALDRVGGLTVLNPGSYVDPRGARPAFATVRRAEGVVAELRTPAGDPFRTVEL